MQARVCSLSSKVCKILEIEGDGERKKPVQLRPIAKYSELTAAADEERVFGEAAAVGHRPSGVRSISFVCCLCCCCCGGAAARQLFDPASQASLRL